MFVPKWLTRQGSLKLDIWFTNIFWLHKMRHFSKITCCQKCWDKFTKSWGCWKHPFGIPGVRPMFLKPKLHKESKNMLKTIINWGLYIFTQFSTARAVYNAERLLLFHDSFCAENSLKKNNNRVWNWLFWTHFWISYAILVLKT